MRVVMAVLCVGAVAFLLCVLVALVREWMRLTSRTEMFYLSKFNPSEARGELVVMNSEDIKSRFPTETYRGMAS
jgi:hypothetical protein